MYNACNCIFKQHKKRIFPEIFSSYYAENVYSIIRNICGYNYYVVFDENKLK